MFLSHAWHNVVFGIPLIGVLLALSVFDARHFRIPDAANLAVGGLGLTWSACEPATWPDGIIAACLGGLGTWLLRAAYENVRGTTGLGLGDVKLVAAAGPWVGVAGLPWMLVVASLAGLAFAGALWALRHSINGRTRIAFGPFLALALLAVWLSRAANGGSL